MRSQRLIGVTMRMVSALVLCGATVASAATLTGFSEKEMTAALRGALEKSATDAVVKLGKADGYLKDPKVRIPLPTALMKHEKTLRTIGLGKQLDALTTTMNRAAEAAVPEAKALVLDAVKTMSVADAKAILTGPNDAATAYFQKRTRDPLSAKLLPIVQRATAKTKAVAAYAAVVKQAAKYGLVDAGSADLNAWVTRKALDGLYLTIAENERAIRKDPLKMTSKLLRDVFGSLKP
jgi:Protein of unknown function (DUF4197)